jgi:FixJ family two-component response regulator
MVEAMGAGADDFICKPFSIHTFNEKVTKFRAPDLVPDLPVDV